MAALSVVFYHSLVMSPLFARDPGTHPSTVANLFIHTPLHIVWAGYEAVVFFFVLSGYVLALKFFREPSLSYSSFLIGRFFRIYLPCYVVTLCAISLQFMLSDRTVHGLSGWFNNIWAQPVTAHSIIDHLMLLGHFGYGQYNPVLWTLVMEMRVSLIFPLLILLVKKFSWQFVLFTGVVLNALYYLLTKNRQSDYLLSISVDYLYTFSLLFMFVLGIILAKNTPTITATLKALSFRKKLLFLILALLLYTIKFWSDYFTQNSVGMFLSDLSISLGAALFILLALGTGASHVLKRGILRFIGQISYSIYLWHGVVLVGLAYLLYPVLPLFGIWVIGLLTTLCLSYATYKLVERPSVSLGARLAKQTVISRKAK
jgi:peptidoglycan/LPS O-acetylase OafA/YrhL